MKIPSCCSDWQSACRLWCRPVNLWLVLKSLQSCLPAGRRSGPLNNFFKYTKKILKSDLNLCSFCRQSICRVGSSLEGGRDIGHWYRQPLQVLAGKAKEDWEIKFWTFPGTLLICLVYLDNCLMSSLESAFISINPSFLQVLFFVFGAQHSRNKQSNEFRVHISWYRVFRVIL